MEPLGIAVIIVAVIVLAVLYWIPISIAEARAHPDLSGVRTLSLVGVFVFPCWLIAIGYAVIGSAATAAKAVAVAPTPLMPSPVAAKPKAASIWPAPLSEQVKQ